MFFERLPIEVLTLPNREIRILQRKRLQLWLSALREGSVGDADFLEKNSVRPSVGCDVIDGEQKLVTIRL